VGFFCDLETCKGVADDIPVGWVLESRNSKEKRGIGSLAKGRDSSQAITETQKWAHSLHLQAAAHRRLRRKITTRLRESVASLNPNTSTLRSQSYGLWFALAPEIGDRGRSLQK
jgi:hypothetical protein